MSTTFVHILLSQIRPEASFSERRLVHLRRMICHLDHRVDRTTPLQFGRTAKLSARWTKAGVYARHPDTDEVLNDLEIMLSILGGTYIPRPDARDIFQRMPLSEKHCQTRYFSIFRGRLGDLVLNFHDPIAVARLNDCITTHWARIIAPSSTDAGHTSH